MLKHLSRPRYGTYQRGVVPCSKCGSPIHIHKLHTLPDEFSVSCSKCGNRGHYAKRAIGIEVMPERRKKPRPQ